MPVPLLVSAVEAPFVAYLHHLQDLAGVVGGHYGVEGSTVEGVYTAVSLHPPAWELRRRELTADELRVVAGRLDATWSALGELATALDGAYERALGAVLPSVALEAVEAAAAALAVVAGDDMCGGHPRDPRDEAGALEDLVGYLGERAAEGVWPYPWSAFCEGCPQIGEHRWGGGVLPDGPFASVLSRPDPSTSDARVALLLRTTRARALERRFAVARQTGVRPGRSRRNLSRAEKDTVAASLPPTTVFDVVARVAARAAEDATAAAAAPAGGRVAQAFVDGPRDLHDARAFAVALALVVDGCVAAVEAAIGMTMGFEPLGELAASWCRRAPGPAAMAAIAPRASAAAALTG